MRFFYITPLRIPSEKANAIQTIKTCEALAKKTELMLIAPRPRHDRLDVDLLEYYGLSLKPRIVRLASIDLMDFSFGSLSEKIFSYLNAFTFSLAVFLYIALKTKKTDVVYSRHVFPLVLPCLFLRRKTVYEAHEVMQSKSSFFLNKLSENIVLKKSSIILSITEHLKLDIAKLANTPVFVVPDGVDLKKFRFGASKQQARKKLGLPPKGKLVMYTGHFYEWKGVDTLVSSMKKINAKLVLVGGFKRGHDPGGHIKYVERIIQLIHREKLEDRIILAGTVPHSKVPLYLLAADVLVIPNSAKLDISRKYTSPLKLYEYMAACRPVVASDLPALREVLNRQNSFLFEPDNPDSLAENVKKALQTPGRGKALAALKDAKKQSWDSRANKILEAIK